MDSGVADTTAAGNVPYSARLKARLARKRAEEPPKDPLEELLDDVQDYMDEQDGSKPAGVAVERPGDG